MKSYLEPELPVIQGLWVRGRLTPMQELSIRSFLANGHPYDLYSYDQIANVPLGARLLPATTILPESEIFTMREGVPHEGSYSPFSDLFRYKLLLERGGWWSDLDVICLKPFDFNQEWVFSSERREDGGILTATCVIRAPAGSDLLQECYERARRHEERDLVWPAIGPYLWHEMIDLYKLRHFVRPPEVFCPIDWWRADDYRKPGEVSGSSWADHLWYERWRLADWSTEPEYEESILYQKLHLRYPSTQ